MATKPPPSADMLALIADFNSLLGPSIKSSKRVVAPKIAVKPPLHRYAVLEKSRSWKPTHTEQIIVRQHCAECGLTTEYVQAPQAVFVSTRLKAKQFIPVLAPDLPLILREVFESVPQCAHCLRLEQRVTDACECHGVQLPLFAQKEEALCL